MNKTYDLRRATRQWIDGFSQVPASVIRKLAEHDEGVHAFDSDTFRLIASPGADCGHCGEPHPGSETLADLTELHARGRGIACGRCNSNGGGDWTMAYPRHAFPCAWGTLFSPNDGCDLWWIREHADEVARLGFHVFESEDWGVLLGVDGAGYDFVEALWVPLYRLRSRH